MLVRLRTDGELEGLREAVPLTYARGVDLGTIERSLLRASRRFRRADLSDFSGTDPLRGAVETFIHVAAGRLPGPAKSALEMALFDLAGEGVGQAGLGPARRERRFRCAVTPPWSRQRRTRWPPTRAAGRPLGFGTFKLKVGAGDDVAQVRAVREALGPRRKLRLDANGAWSVAEALGVLRMVEPLDVELVEQPVAELRELAEVSRDIVVAADESIERQGRPARHRRVRPRDEVKLAKVGGIGEANRISGHLPIYLSSALDGPLGIAAAAPRRRR